MTLWLVLLLAAAPARSAPEPAAEVAAVPHGSPPAGLEARLDRAAAPAGETGRATTFATLELSQAAPGFESGSATSFGAATSRAAVTEQVGQAASAAGATVEAVEKKGDSDARSAGSDLQAALEGAPPRRAGDDAVQEPAGAPVAPSPRLLEPTPRPRWRRALAAVPYVTLGLAAANAAAYHGEGWAIPRYFHGDLGELLRALAFSPASPWYTALTSMFVHDDPNHIGHNVSNILFFGSSLELLTRRRAAMLAIYFAAGVATPLLLLTGLAQPALLYGASGALFGLMGALVGSLWRAPETPWDILAWVPGVIAINAFVVEVGQWLHPADVHVSHLAHVVGFLVGLVLARKMLKSKA